MPTFSIPNPYVHPVVDLTGSEPLLLAAQPSIEQGRTGRALLTREEAAAALARRGEAIRVWARKHKVSHVVAYRVLDGRCKGLRGEGHKVAVLLGIKDGEIAS